MERVLVAAKRQFSEFGYDRASVDAIAQASGVTKVTIYSYFPTKADLFQASVAHRLASEFGSISWDKLHPAKPREALTRVGRAFMAVMRSSDVLKTHRVLYGAIGAERTVAEKFYAVGPTALVDAIALYLQAAQATGSLAVKDPQLAADQFLSLFLGLGHIRGLLGLDPPGRSENEARLAANVDMFLRAHQP
jgi:TetR/AcrR family transcriptional repressor of mexJK operon